MNPLGILEWAWNALPDLMQLGVIAFIAFTSIGGILSLYNFIRSFAGRWSIPAMLSLVIPLGLWLFSLLPKKRDTDVHEGGDGKDFAPSVRKPKPGKESVTRKPRETVSDWFKRATGQD